MFPNLGDFVPMDSLMAIKLEEIQKSGGFIMTDYFCFILKRAETVGIQILKRKFI